MCTVTYLPKLSGFILTHNRDEAPARSTKKIVREETPGGHTLLFPRDALAGGSWIATSRQGRTACILNGAFVLHTRQPPYRRSRGLILLDFFDWEKPEEFFQRYDFDSIEPFTMLFFEKNQKPEKFQQEENFIRILEFRWDGARRFLKNIPANQPHFWCSATLYPAAMQERREQVFREWLTHHPKILKSPSPQSLIALHLTGSIGDPENDFVMNRAGKVQTVSITQIIADEKKAQMKYLDLLDGNRSERRLGNSEWGANTVNR